MRGMLSGATVRDRDGTTGRILDWQLPDVTIGWEDEGKLLPREECLDQDNPRLREEIHVMSLDAGWVPLGNFMSPSGAPTPGHSTVVQMRKLLAHAEDPLGVHHLLDEAEHLMQRRLFRRAGRVLERVERLLAEASKHYPYKNKSKLGPGPRGGTNAKTGNWTCKCANYKCACKGPEGKKKTVVIEKPYKKAYNKEFKAWRKAQKG